MPRLVKVGLGVKPVQDQHGYGVCAGSTYETVIQIIFIFCACRTSRKISGRSKTGGWLKTLNCASKSHQKTPLKYRYCLIWKLAIQYMVCLIWKLAIHGHTLPIAIPLKGSWFASYAACGKRSWLYPVTPSPYPHYHTFPLHSHTYMYAHTPCTPSPSHVTLSFC